MKPRDPRKKVLMRAEVQAGASWTDACILDVSSRGLGLQSAEPPPPGSYVEVRSGSHTVVARVMWATQHRFGLKAQDPVLMSAIASGSAPCPVKTRPVPGNDAPWFGKSVEFVGLALAVGAAALLLADMAGKTLSEPLSQVQPALARD